jgi:hypothetical protein
MRLRRRDDNAEKVKRRSTEIFFATSKMHWEINSQTRSALSTLLGKADCHPRFQPVDNSPTYRQMR